MSQSLQSPKQKIDNALSKLRLLVIRGFCLLRPYVLSWNQPTPPVFFSAQAHTLSAFPSIFSSPNFYLDGVSLSTSTIPAAGITDGRHRSKTLEESIGLKATR